jgi:hypothetical protein
VEFPREGISQFTWKRNGVSLRAQTKDQTRLVFAESGFPEVLGPIGLTVPGGLLVAVPGGMLLNE